MTDPEVLTAAYHEAGHAVAALSLHHAVEEASIKPARSSNGEKTAGMVCILGDNISAMASEFAVSPLLDQCRSRIIDAARERALDLVTIAVAGCVGERIFLGSRSRLRDEPSDYAEAESLANVIVASRRRRRDLIRAAQIVAGRILLARGCEVRALAEALMERRTLSGQEVRTVLKRARAIERRTPKEVAAIRRQMLSRQAAFGTS